MTFYNVAIYCFHFTMRSIAVQLIKVMMLFTRATVMYNAQCPMLLIQNELKLFSIF